MLQETIKKGTLDFERPAVKGTIFGVLLIVITIVGYVFFIKPMVEGVSVAKADLLAKKSQIEQLKTQVDIYARAEKEFELSTEVKRLESLKAVPLDSDQDEVIRDVVEIATANDVVLNSISFSQGEARKSAVGSLRVSASFEGNYGDLVNFLEGLEQNARLFRVDSINVQLRDVEIAGVRRANFALTFETFFQQK